MTLQEYINGTIGAAYKMPKTLEKLWYFETQYGSESYSECFGLNTYDDHFEYYFDFGGEELEDYLKYIKIFAVSDGSGGRYAFWIKENETDLENAPIVSYSSEGDIRIVAQNLKELLRLLTFGTEITDGTAYKDMDDYEECENRHIFINWIMQEFGLEPVSDIRNGESGESDDVKKIIADAQKKYQQAFIDWHEKYQEIDNDF